MAHTYREMAFHHSLRVHLDATNQDLPEGSRLGLEDADRALRACARGEWDLLILPTTGGDARSVVWRFRLMAVKAAQDYRHARQGEVLPYPGAPELLTNIWRRTLVVADAPYNPHVLDLGAFVIPLEEKELGEIPVEEMEELSRLVALPPDGEPAAAGGEPRLDYSPRGMQTPRAPRLTME